MSTRLQVADVSVEIKRSSRRKTIDLTVDRGGEIVLSGPSSLTDATAEQIIRGKLVWIYTMLGRKQETQSNLPAKEFVSGEGFYYLGRNYRLQLCPPGKGADSGNPLTFTDSRFYLFREAVPQAKELFVNWYKKEATTWIIPRCDSLKNRVDANPGKIEIRDLGYRWGSCSKSGNLQFHWRTILLPPERIEYLIIHELVHLHEHNHSKAFYKWLERACPGYKKHELWFSKNGDSFYL